MNSILDLFTLRQSDNDSSEMVKECKGSSISDDDLHTFISNHVNTSTPLIMLEGCMDVASKWTHHYLKANTQEGLDVDVDIAPPSSKGLFPDTKEEREAFGIEEKTVPFETILDGSCKPSRDHYVYLQQQSWSFDIVFPTFSRDLSTLSNTATVTICRSKNTLVWNKSHTFTATFRSKRQFHLSNVW